VETPLLNLWRLSINPRQAPGAGGFHEYPKKVVFMKPFVGGGNGSLTRPPSPETNCRPSGRQSSVRNGHCSTPCYNDHMAREITQRELRNESGEIMRRLDEGETFVVTRNGVPVGELAPLRRHRFVRSDAAVALFRQAPEVEYTRFRDDLDRVSSEDPTPRG